MGRQNILEMHLNCSFIIFLQTLSLGYSGTPFERSPWPEAKPSVKAKWQCQSKHECIDFSPWQEATPLERPHFQHKRGGLTRGTLLYLDIDCLYTFIAVAATAGGRIRPWALCLCTLLRHSITDFGPTVYEPF